MLRGVPKNSEEGKTGINDHKSIFLVDQLMRARLQENETQTAARQPSPRSLMVRKRSCKLKKSQVRFIIPTQHETLIIEMAILRTFLLRLRQRSTEC